MFKNTVIVLLSMLCLSATTYAKDIEHKLPIQDVLNSADFASKIGNDVKFYFGNKSVSGRRLGSFVTNKKTNAFHKPYEVSCQRAMLSALISFRDRAKTQGGNRVVNIVSYYDKETFSSTTEYVCHAGSIMSGVALKGMIVRH